MPGKARRSHDAELLVPRHQQAPRRHEHGDVRAVGLPKEGALHAVRNDDEAAVPRGAAQS